MIKYSRAISQYYELITTVWIKLWHDNCRGAPFYISYMEINGVNEWIVVYWHNSFSENRLKSMLPSCKVVIFILNIAWSHICFYLHVNLKKNKKHLTDAKIKTLHHKYQLEMLQYRCMNLHFKLFLIVVRKHLFIE